VVLVFFYFGPYMYVFWKGFGQAEFLYGCAMEILCTPLSSRLLCRYMFAHLKGQEFLYKIACTNIEGSIEFDLVVKVGNFTKKVHYFCQIP